MQLFADLAWAYRLGFRPSSRATTARRSLRGERRPLSRRVGDTTYWDQLYASDPMGQMPSAGRAVSAFLERRRSYTPRPFPAREFLTNREKRHF
jgi:hypothetical protein